METKIFTVGLLLYNVEKQCVSGQMKYYIISAYCKESNNNTKDLIYCNDKIYMIYILCRFFKCKVALIDLKCRIRNYYYILCVANNYTFLLREIRNVIIIIGLVGVLQKSPPCEDFKT
jgi:hypothetical protein